MHGLLAERRPNGLLQRLLLLLRSDYEVEEDLPALPGLLAPLALDRSGHFPLEDLAHLVLVERVQEEPPELDGVVLVVVFELGGGDVPDGERRDLRPPGVQEQGEQPLQFGQRPHFLSYLLREGHVVLVASLLRLLQPLPLQLQRAHSQDAVGELPVHEQRLQEAVHVAR